MSHTTSAAIALVARPQMGVVGRDQLLRAGVSRSTIWRRHQNGALVRCGPSTYRVLDARPSPESEVLVWCLEYSGVASHRTAAWLHGWIDRPPVIEITVPRGRRRWPPPPPPPGVVVHSSTDLPVEDVLLVHGVPTLSAARTLLSLGALVPAQLAQEDLAELVALACERRQVSERWLFWLLERRRVQGRDGVTAFEEALATRVRLGPTESWLERTVLRTIEEAGLPLPRVQRRVERRGRFVARVDFAYDDRHAVLEALGHRNHRSRADLERDTRRANALTLAGKTVVQWGYDQVVTDPGSIVADVRTILGLDVAAAA